MLNWKQQKQLAQKMGVSPTFISDILNRRVQCPPKRAHRMTMVYKYLFNVYVPPHEWVFNKISQYPVFRPLTAEEQQNIEKELYYGANQ